MPEYLLRPDIEEAIRAVQSVQRKADLVAKGKMRPDMLRDELVYQYMRRAQRATWRAPEGSQEVHVRYKQRDGYVVPMVWDVLFHGPAPMVLGFCPACYVRAPSQVDWRQGDKGMAIGQQFGVMKGNPEANEKLRRWSLSHPGIYVDDRGRLSIPIVVRCNYVNACGWAVRVENSIARWVPSGTIVRARKRGGPIKGPLIIVK